MIFYTVQQWLTAWSEIVLWAKSQAFMSIEESEGRIDAELESGKVWRVRHLATFWAARSHQKSDFKIGDYIRVVGRKGLTLFIEPIESNEQ
ncbi:MAG: hypothetical protein AAF810_12965 [Cyanobacteria bacterium P01_D01_bin.36]